MRNLLEEFDRDHGIRPPTILGVREHVFTGRCEHQTFVYIYFLILYILHLTLTVYDAVFPPWPLSCPVKKLAL